MQLESQHALSRVPSTICGRGADACGTGALFLAMDCSFWTQFLPRILAPKPILKDRKTSYPYDRPKSKIDKPRLTELSVGVHLIGYEFEALGKDLSSRQP